jgi:hypothetical protein
MCKLFYLRCSRLQGAPTAIATMCEHINQDYSRCALTLRAVAVTATF